MDDHFDTSGVFEISKFDISKFACTIMILSFLYRQAHISCVMTKFSLCICENNGAYQLHGNSAADHDTPLFSLHR